jgi:shikimate kinase
MLAERRPLYEQVATLVVTTDDRDPEQVADAIDAAMVSL